MRFSLFRRILSVFFCCLISFVMTSCAKGSSGVSAPNLPKVSVICPTYERAEKHPNLYKAFAWQTYENRELLVFDDSQEPSPFFMELKDVRVKYYHNTEKATIGAKRNDLNGKASGEIIAHFDDDDYYAPDYLAQMVDQLGEADLVKVSKWLAWKEYDGSLWEWDTSFIGDCHFVVSGCDSNNVPVNMFAIINSDPNINKGDWNNSNIWGYGFSFVYKKALWEEIPFEDVNWSEDYKFALQAQKLGKKLRHIPDDQHLVVHTLHKKSSSKILPQYRCETSLLDDSVEPWLYPK